MDKISIPASITIEKGFATQRYKWKSENKESIYRKPNKRAVIRFSCKKFAEKISKTPIKKRQISIIFLDNSNVIIKRIKDKKISIQGYSGEHPYIQIVINKCLPKNLWEKLEEANKKSITFPITVNLDLDEWLDINLKPYDFILEIERESKTLMEKAIKEGFILSKISKGREYDLGLIDTHGRKFIIAISSHVAKTKSRSKEKTIQKILMDISKMLPYLSENEKTIPIIITRPIEFEKSWSFTTNRYLNFYREKFGFRFLTTEFKNNWEDNIIRELLKI